MIIAALSAALIVIAAPTSGVPQAAAESAPTSALPVDTSDVPWGGQARAITISPVDDQTAIAGMAAGGLYRTHDGGLTWTRLDAFPMFHVHDVRYDPNDASVVIATTGADSRVDPESGIWRSGDGGDTWTRSDVAYPCLPLPGGLDDNPSAFNIGIGTGPGGYDYIFVATDCGVPISTDGGLTFTDGSYLPELPAGVPHRFFDVAVRPGAKLGTLQAYACGYAGIYEVTVGEDLGWNRVDPPTDAAAIGDTGCHVAISPYDAQTVFLGITSDSDQIFESDDGGATWGTPYVDAATGGGGEHRLIARPSLGGEPNQYELYWSNGYEFRRAHCTVNSAGPDCPLHNPFLISDFGYGTHTDPSDIGFDPTPSGAGDCPLFIANDGGIDHSFYGNLFGGSGYCYHADFFTWEVRNHGITALQIAGMCGTIEGPSAGETDLYIMMQHNGSYYSLDGGATWPGDFTGGDGVACRVDRRPPDGDPSLIRLVATTGTGGTIVGGRAGTDPSDWAGPPGVGAHGTPAMFGHERYAQIGQSPDGLNQLYVRRPETGDQWVAVGPAFAGDTAGSKLQAAGPSASPTFYFTIRTTPFRSDLWKISGNLDSTATLQCVFGTSAACANPGSVHWFGRSDFDWGSVFAVAPSDPNLLYVSDIKTKTIQKSIDGGMSFTVDAELTDLVTGGGAFKFAWWDQRNYVGQVWKIAFDPADPQRILVGTERAGVFASSDGGGTWRLVAGTRNEASGFTPGPGKVNGTPHVTGFFFDDDANTVWFSTYGRGLWRSYADVFPVVVNTASDHDDGACDVTDCTLREAINAANAGPGASTIDFDIPGAGVHTIALASRLPRVTTPVTINGVSQPGSSLGVVKIRIDGASLAGTASGIELTPTSQDDVINGLAFTNFSGAGIYALGADNVSINGNFIGIDPATGAAAGNGYGIEALSVTGMAIGSGSSPNVISGNQTGILLSSSQSNVIQNNRIGTDLSGTAAIPNVTGVAIAGASSANTIGGISAMDRNIISGNYGAAIDIANTGDSGDNEVLGNFIGVDASGTRTLVPNGNPDILIEGDNNTIGGPTYGSCTAPCNVISGSILIRSNGNNIWGNHIGTGVNGIAAFGGPSDGIRIEGNDNQVGIDYANARHGVTGNVITHFGGAGILVYSGSGNALEENSIYDNRGLGIDLFPPFGVNENDVGDSDGYGYANHGQNYPVLQYAVNNADGLTVAGTLNSTSDTTFYVDFYQSHACDRTGYGEGHWYLGYTSVTTDAEGNGAFIWHPDLPSSLVDVGAQITATATRDSPPRDTSEFSACTQVSSHRYSLSVTGIIGGQVPFTGTLQLEQFVANTDGIQAEIAGITTNGVVVAGAQQVAVQGLVTFTDPKLGEEAVGFTLPAVQGSDSQTLNLDPILVVASQLPAGAEGNLSALSEAIDNGAATQAVASVLNATFGLIPGAGPYQ